MNAFIVDGVFTPRASVRKGVSAYSDVHPQELVATCFKSLHARNEAIFSHVMSAYIGCVSQVGEQGANLARNAVLSAGLDESIAAATVNMCCGSGLLTVNLAAASVGVSAEPLVLAGGVESMSRVKMASDGGGMDGNNLLLRQKLIQVPQGISADFIAGNDRISRAELDAFAVESQRKAAAAEKSGYFQSAYALVHGDDGTPLLTGENHIRADSSLESLGSLSPAFAALGEHLTDAGAIGEGKAIGTLNYVHTAGTSSGIADGAGVLLVAGKSFVEQTGVRPRARILATRTRGSDPVSMLTGPAECSRELLKAANLSVADVDLWEINEAFAVVPIQTIRSLKIDPSRVNIAGGAIARGHPLGATGAILLTSMVTELEKQNASIGCVVLCVAGGQSAAILVERC